MLVVGNIIIYINPLRAVIPKHSEGSWGIPFPVFVVLKAVWNDTVSGGF